MCTEFELMLGSVDTKSMHSICVVVSCIHHTCVGLNVNRPLYSLYVCVYICMYIDVERCWKKLIPIFVIMATVMYFLIAIVWIVTFTTYTLCKLDISF